MPKKAAKSKKKADSPNAVHHCTVCTKEIVTMCFRGTGVCSQKCEKAAKA